MTSFQKCFLRWTRVIPTAMGRSTNIQPSQRVVVEKRKSAVKVARAVWTDGKLEERMRS